jgi:hypothetical protein
METIWAPEPQNGGKVPAFSAAMRVARLIYSRYIEIEVATFVMVVSKEIVRWRMYRMEKVIA